MKRSKKESISIRIPVDYYEKLKELAETNKRPLSSELVIILDDYLSEGSKLRAERRLRALNKVRGIIKDLPKGNYSQTIDDVLYGKIER